MCAKQFQTKYSLAKVISPTEVIYLIAMIKVTYVTSYRKTKLFLSLSGVFDGPPPNTKMQL